MTADGNPSTQGDDGPGGEGGETGEHRGQGEDELVDVIRREVFFHKGLDAVREGLQET